MRKITIEEYIDKVTIEKALRALAKGPVFLYDNISKAFGIRDLELFKFDNVLIMNLGVNAKVICTEEQENIYIVQTIIQGNNLSKEEKDLNAGMLLRALAEEAEKYDLNIYQLIVNEEFRELYDKYFKHRGTFIAQDNYGESKSIHLYVTKNTSVETGRVITKEAGNL